MCTVNESAVPEHVAITVTKQGKTNSIEILHYSRGYFLISLPYYIRHYYLLEFFLTVIRLAVVAGGAGFSVRSKENDKLESHNTFYIIKLFRIIDIINFSLPDVFLGIAVVASSIPKSK